MREAVKLPGNKIDRRGNTLFVRLPGSCRTPIIGGCDCNYCKAHPYLTPEWDCLGIDQTDGATWRVHFPELRG